MKALRTKTTPDQRLPQPHGRVLVVVAARRARLAIGVLVLVLGLKER